MSPLKVLQKFSEMLRQVEKSQTTLLVFLPLEEEMRKQATVGPLNGQRVLDLCEGLLTNKRLNLEKHGPALMFVLEKWPNNDWVPKTNTVTVNNTNIGGGTTFVSNSGKTTGIGKQWEQQIQRNTTNVQNEKQREKEQSFRLRVELGEKSKESRFEKAMRDLNANPWVAWFEYLRDAKTIPNIQDCPYDGTVFNGAVAYAKQKINPLLTGRTIYDDSRAVTEDPEGSQQSQGKEAMIRVVLEHYNLGDWKTPGHWFAKGLILSLNTDITIRCDGSAALAFYLLATDRAFRSSIALVKQGDPGMSGHWFLMAGVKADLLDQNLNRFGAKQLQNSWTFIIDLWGAAFQKYDNAVYNPAQCIAGDWKPSLVWKV